MTRTALRKEWEAQIADFKASGQSASKWCAAHHLKIHQFRYWLSKLSKPAATTSSKWLPVEVDGQPDESMNTLLIRVGLATIEVKPGFDPALLTDVVRTLRALC